MAVTASTSEKKAGNLQIDRILRELEYFGPAKGQEFDTLAEYAAARTAIIAIKTKFDV